MTEKQEKTLSEKIVEDILKNRPPKKLAVVDGYATKKAEAKEKPKSPPIVPKYYYDVKVECMLPATLTYRVLAEDAKQASELIRGASPVGVKHRLIGKKDIKMSVYRAGSSMLEWAKNLLGR